MAWAGTILSVQPRIRLTRSYDERSHSYLGFALRLEGQLDGRSGAFSVGIGPGAQDRLGLSVGDRVEGSSHPVGDARLEPVEYYRTSKLRVIERATAAACEPPPWVGVPPPLATYRERGHRRLHAPTYEAQCVACLWGCRMPVEIIIDQWNPSRRRYRFETFCYGPKDCPVYRAGATRKVQGRKPDMVYEEEDWVDEEATRHRQAED